MSLINPTNRLTADTPAGEACLSDFKAGRRSGLFVGFLLGAMFAIGVWAAARGYSIFI